MSAPTERSAQRSSPLARLREASEQGASWQGERDLAEARLDGEDLSGLDLSSLDLRGANFMGSRAAGSILREANLSVNPATETAAN